MKTISKITFVGTVGTMIMAPVITAGAGDASASTAQIKTLSTTTSSTITTSNTTSNKNYTVTTSVLNIRENSSVNSKLIGTLTKGSTLTGTVTNGWLKITSGVNSGRYVSADYIKFVSNATTVNTSASGGSGAITQPVQSNITNKYAINASSLNVHTVASSSGTLAGYLMKDSILTGTIVNGWLKINSGMYKSDYVSAAFLNTVNDSGNSGTISNSSAENNLRSKIISLAASQAGTTYIWGASQPGYGFDCSGLTSWVYKQVGMTIPRVSRDQAAYATPISSSQVKPGDLVFLYDSTGRVYHVGMSLNVSDKSYWNATDAGSDSVQLNHYSFTKLYKYGNMIGKFVQ